MMKIVVAIGFSLLTLSSTFAFAHQGPCRSKVRRTYERTEWNQPKWKGRVVCKIGGGHRTLCTPTWVED